MNWCKIGLHDWEVIDDTRLLWKAVRDFLKGIGFTQVSSEDDWDRWEREDGVKLWEFLPFHHGGIESVIPSSPESKACLRCGKTHKNYSEAKVLKKVEALVAEAVNEKAREKKARELLGRSDG